MLNIIECIISKTNKPTAKVVRHVCERQAMSTFLPPPTNHHQPNEKREKFHRKYIRPVRRPNISRFLCNLHTYGFVTYSICDGAQYLGLFGVVRISRGSHPPGQPHWLFLRVCRWNVWKCPHARASLRMRELPSCCARLAGSSDSIVAGPERGEWCVQTLIVCAYLGGTRHDYVAMILRVRQLAGRFWQSVRRGTVLENQITIYIIEVRKGRTIVLVITWNACKCVRRRQTMWFNITIA